ncbi:MAG TPA: sigma factor, partial [Candidatus Kapabacteria bacterium]
MVTLGGSNVAMAVTEAGEVVETREDILRAAFDAFLAGDTTAFALLYSELNPRLSAYCYKLMPANADDLMQELWERVITMRTTRTPAFSRRGQGVVNPVAFLFRMLKNLAIDHHRRSKDYFSLDE